MPYLILFFSFVNLLLGIMIFLRTNYERENLFFIFFATLASIWTFNNFYLRLFPETIFLRSAYGIGVLVATAGLIWVYLFLKERIPFLIKIVVLPFSFLIAWGAIFSDSIVSSLRSVEILGYEAETGKFFPLYVLFIGIIIVLIIYKLLSGIFLERDILRRSQIIYIFVGTVIFAVTSLIVSFLIPTFFNTLRFTILDNISFSIFLIFIAYAIVKHQLFNIRVIATELLVFTIWIFLLIRTLLAESLREQLIDGSLLVLVIFFGALLIRSVLKEVRLREEIQRLSEGLRSANRELKKLDQLKSEFLSLATHQLRTPLSIVKGYISMVQEGTFGGVPEKMREALRRVYVSNERLINLVNDFLNISRIESGRMQYDFAPLHIEELIESVADEFRQTASAKNLELVWERPQEILPTVSADREKFRQVFVNILDNAVKYTPAGSITVEAERESRAEGGGDILISVKDTGMGMNTEELDMVFKRFSRGETGARVYKGGLGLGLYLAKRIVQDHGGEIWAESKGPGEGSAFFIRLPVKK